MVLEYFKWVASEIWCGGQGEDIVGLDAGLSMENLPTLDKIEPTFDRE